MEDLLDTLRDYVDYNLVDSLRRRLKGLDVNMIVIESDSDGCYDMGSTLLHMAARKNRLEILDMLIQMGCNIEATSWFDETALAVASRFGHFDIVLRLIDCHSNLDHVDKLGWTPIFHAVQEDIHLNVVAILLAAKGIDPFKVNQNAESIADMNRLDYDGYSLLGHLLHSMTGNGPERIECLRMLINAGCDVNKGRGFCKLPLYNACVSHDAVDIAKLLIEHGADVHAASPKSGKTLLMAAASEGNPSMVRFLLDAGVDLHAKDSKNDTALHWAVGKLDTVRENVEKIIDNIRILVEAGSDVNSPGSFNRTPFMLALSSKKINISMITLMLRAGAATKAVDDYGFTPLIFAVANSGLNGKYIRLLLDADSSVVNKRSRNGLTALQWAMKISNLDAVRELLTVKDIEVSMSECLHAAVSSPANHFIVTNGYHSCLTDVAVFVIKRQWRECYWNPKYAVCRKRLMKEGEAMERYVKRLRRSRKE